MSGFELDSNGIEFIEDLASKAVGNLVHEIYEDTYRVAPEDTGELKRSIREQHQPGDLTGYVIVGTDHWDDVEYGTKDESPNPFMRSSIYKQRIIDSQ